MGLFWGNIQQFAGAPPAPVFPTSGLTSYWRFDETSGTAAADQIGYADMTLEGNVSFAANGKNNYCATVAGATTRTIYGGDKYNWERTQPWTMSGWLKFPVGNTSIATFMSKESTSGSGYRGWAMLWVNSPTNAGSEMYIINNYSSNNYILRGSTTDYETGSTTVNDGLWHMITFTYDGTSKASGVTNYYDTVNISAPTYGKDTLTATIISAAAVDFCIGGREQGGRGMSAGNIDECAMWDRVLSTEEIAAVYNSGAGLFY